MRIDVTGQTFGRLSVLSMTRRSNKAACVVRCECGKTKTVRWCSINDGETTSCGCVASERIALANLTHGECIGKHSVEWITWRSMRQRCTNPRHKSYQDYGGRGIRVCDRWSTIVPFLEDMGRRPTPQHSLDRIDNSGHYEPGNCRWATKSEQARNRRARPRMSHDEYKARMAFLKREKRRTANSPVEGS